MTLHRRGRAVPIFNATVATALLGLLAAVALVVRPPSPPGIAEFAPQAAKPISKAPPGQASMFDDGTGPCQMATTCTDRSRQGTGAGKPVPRPTTGQLAVPSALQCYTWPDGSVTQTFDPQSPPCIASWPEAARGNGGATTRGVDATTVRIGIPMDPASKQRAQFQPLFDFFNTHYEFYGRRLDFVMVKPITFTANQ